MQFFWMINFHEFFVFETAIIDIIKFFSLTYEYSIGSYERK